MVRQFASASLVASIFVALASLVVVVVPGLGLQRAAPLLAVWCAAPLIWGLWAAVAPSAWVPQRFPLWGGILGLVAGSIATFVLNMPFRVLDLTLPAGVLGALAIAMAAFYSLMWMAVRRAYRALGGPAAATRPTEITSRAA